MLFFLRHPYLTLCLLHCIEENGDIRVAGLVDYMSTLLPGQEVPHTQETIISDQQGLSTPDPELVTLASLTQETDIITTDSDTPQLPQKTKTHNGSAVAVNGDEAGHDENRETSPDRPVVPPRRKEKRGTGMPGTGTPQVRIYILQPHQNQIPSIYLRTIPGKFETHKELKIE